jgi:hypothetical protein
VEALRQGAADFILKPFQNEVLVRSLREVVERGSGAGPQDSSDSRASTAASRLDQDLSGTSPVVDDLRTLVNEDRTHGKHGPHHRGIGNGQGGGGARPAPAFAPSGPSVPAHPLRRAERRPPGKRALRPCQGLLHRRRRGFRGTVRGRQRGHRVPGRGGRDPPLHPGEAPARAPGTRSDSRGRAPAHCPSTCASSRRRTPISKSSCPADSSGKTCSTA